MDFQSTKETIKLIFQVIWWIVTNFPGVIVPCVIASILAAIFHWKNDIRDLVESILGFFF